MVDVGDKQATQRTAHARTAVQLPDAIAAHISDGEIETRKGPVFATAIIAGVMAAKRTHELIPFCHPLGLDNCKIEIALQDAAKSVTGESGKALKRRLRTGTVVTTDDRNWELRFSATATRFNQSRAIAVDMESATIAANGFRLRVPYGVLLCVSDKPLHGEIKLPGAANRFYERAIGEHIRIGIETLERLAEDGGSALHSRKLRAFDEPPFR